MRFLVNLKAPSFVEGASFYAKCNICLDNRTVPVLHLKMTDEEKTAKKVQLEELNRIKDLLANTLKSVEKWVRNAGSPAATKITDTANWYEVRLDGKDLFVIYKNEKME